MLRRLLKSFEEGIEGGRSEHVHLVDDKHLILTDLRWDGHLLDKIADIVDRVVGGAIELIDVVGTLFVERLARFALVASLAFGTEMFAVDGLGENTGTGSLANASWTTEQIGMRQFATHDGILERLYQSLLAYNCVPVLRTVFSGRYDVI